MLSGKYLFLHMEFTLFEAGIHAGTREGQSIRKKIQKKSIFFECPGTKPGLPRYCDIRMVIASTQHARPQPTIRTYSRSPPGE